MMEMPNIGILVGGIGKAMLAGGRGGAAGPGHWCVAARTPLGLLSMLLVPKGRTQCFKSQVFRTLSYLCCILINQ